MTHTLLLLAFVASQSGESTALVKFDTLTIEQATRLDGRAVSIALSVDAPAYTIGESERLITVRKAVPAPGKCKVKKEK